MARRKKTLRTGAVLRVRKHAYEGDGIPDHWGRDRCGLCGLGEDHAVHDVEPPDPETADHARRITGERG